jgi:PAS domain S-box-containing protein
MSLRFPGSNESESSPPHDRRGEAALGENEQRLRATYDRAPVGIAETDQAGRFLRVNDAFCALTGHTRDELLRLRLADITHPDEVERDLDEYRRQWSDEIESYTMEKRYLHKSGRPLWISVSSSVVRDAAGRPLYAIRVTQDISDRKQAEESLAEETRSLETLNRVGGLLSAELDLERLVQAATDAATELTGARFGAFFYNIVNEHGESYKLYTLSGLPRAVFARFGTPRATAVFGPTFRGEGVLRSDDITLDPRYGGNAPHHGMPKGHPPVRSYLAVPVISRSGEVLGGLFFGHDKAGVFTDRAERAASGIAAQAAIAIDNARLFQKLQEEVAERARVEGLLRELNEILEQRVAARSAELEEASRRLVREAEERRQAEAALLQAQKLEAIGRLTGGIAHDFNNLLTAILGNLELAQVRVTDAKVRRQLETAAGAGRRGAKLIQQLLAYSRKQHLEPRAVDVNALIGDMRDLLQRTLGGLVQVETDLAPGTWHASTDPTQLELVILNLAINARDAMPSGGALRIETGNVERGGAALPRELAEGDFVRIAVADTGTGMAPEILDRAMEPFFTTKDVGKGSGLGLPQVYGVAKQSGGTVRLSSTVGVGTTVELWLPRSAEALARRPYGPPAAGTAGERGRGSLLIVDDEVDLRRLAASFLEAEGYVVKESASGSDALALLDGGARFDLALVDYAMPGMSGTEFVRLARKLVPSLRILYITGYADPIEATFTGNELVLTKPYTRLDLLQAVASMLDRMSPRVA